MSFKDIDGRKDDLQSGKEFEKATKWQGIRISFVSLNDSVGEIYGL